MLSPVRAGRGTGSGLASGLACLRGPAPMPPPADPPHPSLAAPPHAPAAGARVRGRLREVPCLQVALRLRCPERSSTSTPRHRRRKAPHPSRVLRPAHEPHKSLALAKQVGEQDGQAVARGAVLRVEEHVKQQQYRTQHHSGQAACAAICRRRRLCDKGHCPTKITLPELTGSGCAAPATRARQQAAATCLRSAAASPAAGRAKKLEGLHATTDRQAGCHSARDARRAARRGPALATRPDSAQAASATRHRKRRTPAGPPQCLPATLGWTCRGRRSPRQRRRRRKRKRAPR